MIGFRSDSRMSDWIARIILERVRRRASGIISFRGADLVGYSLRNSRTRFLTQQAEVAMLKAKIEMVANVVVILLAVAIGFVFLKDRFANPDPEPNEVKAGDRLMSLEGWDWSAHDRTLLLVLRKGCHFCEDSAPFYQRIVAKQQQDRSNTAIVAALPDAADAAKEVVKSERLEVQALAGVPLGRLKVSATPTLLLVDNSGAVLNTWVGLLSPQEELEVMRANLPPR
jgi:thioredoxin-related protein